MILRNNDLGNETDGKHSYRAHIMAVGILVYGEVPLGFTPLEQVPQIAGYAALFDTALSAQAEESADVSEVFAEIAEADALLRRKHSACQEYLVGECQFADKGTVTYLEDRFDMFAGLPNSRGDMIKVVRDMLVAYDNIGVEHPDIALSAVLFGELQTLFDSLIAIGDTLEKEYAEKKETTTNKNVLRIGTGEKLMRWVFHRAKSYMGDDDPKLLELGFVPVSMIWTPGTSLPAVTGLTYDPNTNTLSFDADPDAKDYDAQVAPNDEAPDWTTIYSGEENQCVHNPGVGEWLFRVRANDEVKGEWSEPLEVTIAQ